jgi:hypothetical protein
MAPTEGQSGTGKPGPSSRPVARPSDHAHPVGSGTPQFDEANPQQDELDSLRRLLAEKDEELTTARADAAKYADVAAMEQRLNTQIQEIREANLTAERQVNATRTLPEARAEGYGALLQQAGFVQRPEKATGGKGNPLPEGHIYRLTAPARYPAGHPAEGQLCYQGITCVIIPAENPTQAPIIDEGRQHCIRFVNGIGLTDDREAAWAMANTYNYDLAVEDRPVVQVQRPAAEFVPILEKGKLVGAAR